MGNLILHEIRLNLMTNYKVNPNNTFYKCVQVCPLTCTPVRNMTAHKKLWEDKLYINSMDKKVMERTYMKRSVLVTTSWNKNKFKV